MGRCLALIGTPIKKTLGSSFQNTSHVSKLKKGISSGVANRFTWERQKISRLAEGLKIAWKFGENVPEVEGETVPVATPLDIDTKLVAWYIQCFLFLKHTLEIASIILKVFYQSIHQSLNQPFDHDQSAIQCVDSTHVKMINHDNDVCLE